MRNALTGDPGKLLRGDYRVSRTTQRLLQDVRSLLGPAAIIEDRERKPSRGVFDKRPVNWLVVKRTLGKRFVLGKRDFIAAVVRAIDSGLGTGFARAKDGASNLPAIHASPQGAGIGA